MQALSDNSGSYPNVDSSDGVARTLWGLGPDGQWQNLTPEAPHWAGPTTWDPNAPQPVMQALSDNSGSYPNVDSSDGVVRTLWGLGPDGRWQNLTPEPPVVAGPATYDPNAPEPIVRTLPAQISLVGARARAAGGTAFS